MLLTCIQFHEINKQSICIWAAHVAAALIARIMLRRRITTALAAGKVEIKETRQQETNHLVDVEKIVNRYICRLPPYASLCRPPLTSLSVSHSAAKALKFRRKFFAVRLGKYSDRICSMYALSVLRMSTSVSKMRLRRNCLSALPQGLIFVLLLLLLSSLVSIVVREVQGRKEWEEREQRDCCAPWVVIGVCHCHVGMFKRL